MKTISSIEMRAKIDALSKLQKEIVLNIQQEIAVLMMGIEDEENKRSGCISDIVEE